MLSKDILTFLMLGGNKGHRFSDIKKLRLLYVLAKCPLVYAKALVSKQL